MRIAVFSPLKYIQGYGELDQLPMYCKAYGQGRAYAIVSPSTLASNGSRLEAAFNKAGQTVILDKFNRECCRKEIDGIIEKMKKNSMDVVLAIGGGKTIDTAKAVAHFSGLPVIVVPTIASTDAPCSALSVLYTEDGQFEEYLFLKSNPDAVIVDIDIVVGTPSRLTVSGMGDALATYFEARACAASCSTTISGGKTSKTALALARLCYDILLEDGFKAKIAAELHMSCQALENVIEANTYLSGVGFESGGLAAAHSIHNGFTVLEETHSMYHGEKVAFGTLVQLVLENNNDDLFEVLDFCKSVGLPTTLAELGIKDASVEKIMKVAQAACVEGESIHNMPFPVSPESVCSAIFMADKIGSNA